MRMDGAKVRSVFQSAVRAPHRNVLQRAIQRWNRSSERVDPEDALIDYWVALESLFSPESASELGFRIAVRLAALLGDSGQERMEIFEQARRSYSVRSQVVHGSKYPKDLDAVVAQTRSFARRAILRILKNGPTDMSAIDRQLLTGLFARSS